MARLWTTISTAAAACAIVGAAQASDLRGAIEPQDAPAAPTVWSGFYLGAGVGYGWSAADDQLGLRGDQPTGLASEGALGGLQVGYNMQFSRYVWGVEAELDASGVGDSAHDRLYGDNFSSRLQYLGLLRNRVGYAFDRALVYVDGGLAYGGLTNRVNGPILTGSPYEFSGTALGYALGAGVEYALAKNWSIRSEYLFVDLGKNDPTNAAGATYSGIAGGGWATVRRDAFQVFRIGVDYTFK